MEVVQVCPLFSPYTGGVETHVRQIATRLSDLGVSVKVYTTDPSGQLPRKEIVEGVEVYRFRSYSPKYIYFFSPKLYSALRHLGNADIVHTHGYPNFPALAAAVAKTGGRSLFFTPHYGGYSFDTIGSSVWLIPAKKCYHRFLGKYIFSKVDKVIIVGRFERDLLKKRFMLEDRKIFYVPNGVDAEKFRNLDRKHDDANSLLYVGRLEKYKGVQFLLEALPKLRSLMPNLKLVIVGKGSYKGHLRSLASSLDIQDGVTFLEDVPEEELVQLYLSSIAFVYLSQYEGLPIGLLEAMACGLPIIATRVGGVPEVVRQRETGFLLDFPPNEEELISRIALLLDDPELAVQMGLKARETVLSTFTWSRVAQSLKDLYERFS